MLRNTGIVVWGTIAMLALAGCAQTAENEAIAKAKDQCASEGKQFVQKGMEDHDSLIVVSAKVTGQCVGPGDPGYIAPTAAPAKP